jgi:hypothetical protein
VNRRQRLRPISGAQLHQKWKRGQQQHQNAPSLFKYCETLDQKVEELEHVQPASYLTALTWQTTKRARNTVNPLRRFPRTWLTRQWDVANLQHENEIQCAALPPLKLPGIMMVRHNHLIAKNGCPTSKHLSVNMHGWELWVSPS